MQRALLLSGVAAVVGTVFVSYVLKTRRRRKGRKSDSAEWYGESIAAAIGNTPLVRIRSLSEATGCTILAKLEFLNPGGSVKDRVARRILQEANASGLLDKGGTIYEGTSGSTGVSLALLAKAEGYKCHIVIPDDQAQEKYDLLEMYGATVEKVRPCSISDPGNIVNVARQRAEEHVLAHGPGSAYFADQFESPANFHAHLDDTAQELWDQTGGRVHAVVCGSGTGGTIAGLSVGLKEKNPDVRVFLVDPPGSSLYNKVVRGVAYTREEAEGKRKRYFFDTITEGVGLNRLTANFQRALIDFAFRCSDREAVEMAAYLLRNDGIFTGSSGALNCVGAVKAARRLGPGHVVVTILCDSGQRHLTKFYNPEYLAKFDLLPASTGDDLSFVRQ